jgi:hypothetical protein
MSRYIHPDVLDNGLSEIVVNCDSMVAVIDYTLGDSYATISDSANIVGQVAMADADFTLSTPATTSNRRVTSDTKQDASANNEGDPTHVAWLDTATSRILMVTDETKVETIGAGNPVNFPAVSYTIRQPDQS